MPVGAVLWPVLGVAIVLATLRDLVHELFSPEDAGSLSFLAMRGTWRFARAVARRRNRGLHDAGAQVLIAVASMWTGLLTLGFALVYLPFLPSGFQVNPDLPPPAARGFHTALYVSLASLTTLGSGDIVPRVTGLRVASTLESLFGVALITAWITWVLSIYPVLAHRRAYAREVSLLQRIQPDPGATVAEAPPEAVTSLLRALAEQTLRVAAELSQSRVTYYFQNRSPDLALANQLPFVLALGRTAEAHAEAVLRHHGAHLREAVETLLEVLAQQFLELRDASPERIIEALAADHLLQPGERG